MNKSQETNSFSTQHYRIYTLENQEPRKQANIAMMSSRAFASFLTPETGEQELLFSELLFSKQKNTACQAADPGQKHPVLVPPSTRNPTLINNHNGWLQRTGCMCMCMCTLCSPLPCWTRTWQWVRGRRHIFSWLKAASGSGRVSPCHSWLPSGRGTEPPWTHPVATLKQGPQIRSTHVAASKEDSFLNLEEFPDELFLNCVLHCETVKMLWRERHCVSVRDKRANKQRANHLDVFRYVLEVVLAVLHGDLVVVLTLGDVSHLRLGFVLQQKDGRRHQHAQDDLDTTTHSCGLMRLGFQNFGSWVHAC